MFSAQSANAQTLRTSPAASASTSAEMLEATKAIDVEEFLSPSDDNDPYDEVCTMFAKAIFLKHLMNIKENNTVVSSTEAAYLLKKGREFGIKDLQIVYYLSGNAIK